MSEGDLFDPTEHKGRVPKPELVCPFCAGIRSFGSVVGYWGHIMHKHHDEPEGVRLREIKRAAAGWQDYCSLTDPHRDKDLLTMARVRQACGGAFTWQDVVVWGLRP